MSEAQRGKRIKRARLPPPRELPAQETSLTAPPASNANLCAPPPSSFAPQRPSASEQNPDELGPQNFEGTSVSSSRKKKRGRSCGKRLHDLVEANDGKPLVVHFDPKLKVPANHKMYTLFRNEIGTNIRGHAPVCCETWADVSNEEKQKQLKALQTLFEVDLSKEYIYNFVIAKMSRAYTVFKNRLHTHYKKHACTPARGRATPPPKSLWNGRPIQHWNWLCDSVYTNPDYEQLSKKNSENRKKKSINHRGGACSFVQHALKAVKEGKPLSFIDNYGRLYKDKEHNWISEVAQEKYDKMQQKREELRMKMIEEAGKDSSSESVEVPIEAELKILGEELGVKGKTVRGVGAFPRLEANLSSIVDAPIPNSNSELNELREMVKGLATNIKSVQQENAQVQQENVLLKGQLLAILGGSNGVDNAQLRAQLLASFMSSSSLAS